MCSGHEAGISGQIKDAQGAGVPNASIVVFTVDRSRWDDRSLHRQQLRADQNGRYAAHAPPGEYWVVAAQASELSTKALDQLKGSAVRVTAGPDAVVTQDLPVKP